MVFIPGYDPNSAAGDPPEPFGSTEISQVYGYSNNVFPYQIYVCHLTSAIGGLTSAGWCGSLSATNPSYYDNLLSLVLGFGAKGLQGGNLGFDSRNIISAAAVDGFIQFTEPIMAADFPTGAIAWTVEGEGATEQAYVIGVWTSAENAEESIFIGGPGFFAMIQWALTNWAGEVTS